MILSHARRFVFIKTPKSASTSVEAALSALCGPDDVITPIGPERVARQPDAQNYLRGEAERALRPDGFAEPLQDRDFYNHMPLSKVAEYAGEETVRRYLKIAFVRNPWDRQVSLFHFLTYQGLLKVGFLEWMTWAEPLNVMPMLSLDGAPAMDFIGRYETLQADVETLFRRFGAEAPPALLRLKSGIRPPGDYRSYYDARSRERVAEACAEEIAAFGYRF